MLIAVSSFGEGLRRVLPLTAPAEVILKNCADYSAQFFIFRTGF
jgi:hypothetical protein